MGKGHIVPYTLIIIEEAYLNRTRLARIKQVSKNANRKNAKHSCEKKLQVLTKRSWHAIYLHKCFMQMISIRFSSLAALGLVENNASNIVAAMLVSPLMGPVMSITFGTIISDRTLIRNGFESLVLGMFVSLIFGFIFGLILGSTEMPWGFGDWPTEEMKSR